MTTAQKPAPRAADQPAQKSWIRRHKVFTAFGLLFIAVVVGGTVLAWPLMKLRFHPQYAAAMDEIRSSKTVVERLGEPIKPVRIFPGGTAYDDGKKAGARFVFSVAGPKSTADVFVDATRLDGKWGFNEFKLTLPDKQEINLAAEIQKRDGNDLPKFDPNAKPVEVKQPDLPLDINLPNLPETPGK
jgi:Cytochrome oxidase complex assembly protein 1